ncbi:MAG: hypothetical protein K2O18_16920 [Oscillospiraceae bacterium]|nr:hypothetical protein [Oscillospiraceae bacterium]
MMNILKELYDGQYGVELPKTLEYRAVRHKNVEGFWDKIEEAMGPDFIEKNWENLSRQEELESFEYFRQGFHLGVSLMLELL